MTEYSSKSQVKWPALLRVILQLHQSHAESQGLPKVSAPPARKLSQAFLIIGAEMRLLDYFRRSFYLIPGDFSQQRRRSECFRPFEGPWIRARFRGLHLNFFVLYDPPTFSFFPSEPRLEFPGGHSFEAMEKSLIAFLLISLLGFGNGQQLYDANEILVDASKHDEQFFTFLSVRAPSSSPGFCAC